MRKCACGAVNPDWATECAKCGAPLGAASSGSEIQGSEMQEPAQSPERGDGGEGTSAGRPDVPAFGGQTGAASSSAAEGPAGAAPSWGQPRSPTSPPARGQLGPPPWPASGAGADVPGAPPAWGGPGSTGGTTTGADYVQGPAVVLPAAPAWEQRGPEQPRKARKEISPVALGIVGLFAACVPIAGAPLNAIAIWRGTRAIRQGETVAGVIGLVLGVVGFILTLLNAAFGVYLALRGGP